MTHEEKLRSQIKHYREEIGKAEFQLSHGLSVKNNLERIERAKREIKKREKELRDASLR